MSSPTAHLLEEDRPDALDLALLEAGWDDQKIATDEWWDGRYHLDQLRQGLDLINPLQWPQGTCSICGYKPRPPSTFKKAEVRPALVHVKHVIEAAMYAGALYPLPTGGLINDPDWMKP